MGSGPEAPEDAGGQGEMYFGRAQVFPECHCPAKLLPMPAALRS